MKSKTTEQLTKDLENIIKGLYKNEDMETVRKIVEDILLKSEKEKDGVEIDSGETRKAKVIELLRDLNSQGEIKDKCQLSQSYISRIATENKIYSRRRVITLIKDGESPEKIAQEGNVNLDAVVELKEELDKAQESKEKDLKYIKIIELAKDLIGDSEIAAKVQCSRAYPAYVRNKEKIYSKQKVSKMLADGKSAEDIAQEGNVNLDAVVKLKEELDKRQESKEKDDEKAKDSERAKKEKDLKYIKIIELAKDLIGDSEIAKKVQCSRAYPAYVRNKEKIYSKQKVSKMLADGKSAEDIAKEGNVNLDAVIKLKDKLEKSKKNQHSNRHRAAYGKRKIVPLITQQQEREKNDSRIGAQNSTDVQSIQGDSVRKLPKQYKNNTILRMAYQIKSVDKMVSVLGVSEYTIRNQLRAAGIYTREEVIALVKAGEKTDEEIAEESSTDINEVKAIRMRMLELSSRLKKDEKLKKALEMLQEGSYLIGTIKAKTKKNREELDSLRELFVEPKVKDISPEKRRVEFKIEMMQLTSSIKLGAADTIGSREVNDVKIQKILYKYHELLTLEDYACMAYAYTRTGDYMKAIELAEEHLGLETPSLNGLKEKIQDVLGIGKEERASEELLSSKVVSQYIKPKAGNIGGNDGEHSGR